MIVYILQTPTGNIAGVYKTAELARFYTRQLRKIFPTTVIKVVREEVKE